MESCAIPCGTKALLMDSNKDIFYFKETDMVQNIFDWQNKKIIDSAAYVKTLIDMYK